MFEKISDVAYAFKGWDGVKHSIKMYETSNRLLKAWVYQGTDAMLNPSTIKQLYQYHNATYKMMLDDGFTFLYQGITYNLTSRWGNLFIEYHNPKGVDGSLTLTETGIKGYKRKAHALNDVADVCQGLLDTLTK